MAVELDDTTTNKWSETDASNTQPAPDGAPSGTVPSQAEPIWRGIMATVKRFWNRINGTVTTTGASGHYIYTPVNTTYPTAYVGGEAFCFKAHQDSAGSDDININGLGAKNLKRFTTAGKTAIAAGDIKSGMFVVVRYDGTDMVIDRPVSNVGTYNRQVFTASGTFTATASVPHKITVVGAGGGSGGIGSSAVRSSQGGASGAVAVSTQTLASGTGYTVTTGAAGTAGTSAPTAGGNGGTSSFSGGAITTVQATGGVGGGTGNDATFPTPPLGGTATGAAGDLLITGASPQSGEIQSIFANHIAPNGANTPLGLGSGGIGGDDQSGGRGTVGVGYGSGGGGNWGSSNAGNAGAPGIVIVEWWA